MASSNVPSTSKCRGRGRKFNPYRRLVGPRQIPTSLPIQKLHPIGESLDQELDQDDGLMTTLINPDQEPIISFMLEDTTGQYPGWKLYFPKDCE